MAREGENAESKVCVRFKGSRRVLFQRLRFAASKFHPKKSMGDLLVEMAEDKLKNLPISPEEKTV